MRTFALALVGSMVLLLASCGGGGGSSSTPAPTGPTIAVAGGSQFATFIDAMIGVTQAPGSPIAALGITTQCAADTQNALVFVAYNNNTAVAYRINGDSSATSVSTGAITAVSNVLAEVGGRLLYAAENGAAQQFAVFSIASTGTLQALPNQPATSPVVDLIAHPNGQVLIASETPQALQAFTIDPTTGQLTPLTQPFSGFGGSTVHSMAFVQNGAFLLVAEGVAPNFAVDVLSLNVATGAFTPVGTSVNIPGSLFLAPHPNGRFAYALSNNAITQLTVDTNGVITVGTSVQMPVGVSPVSAAVDRAGAKLLVGGSNGSLLTFAIDPNAGFLTANPLSTTNLSFTPVCVFPK